MSKAIALCVLAVLSGCLTQRQCAPGTLIEGSRCVAEISGCAPGTVRQGGLCVPEPDRCGEGTEEEGVRCRAVLSRQCTFDPARFEANVQATPEEPERFQAEPTVAIDEAGGVHVAYIDVAAGRLVIKIVSSPDGRTFGAPFQPDTTRDRSFLQFDPVLVAAGTRLILVYAVMAGSGLSSGLYWVESANRGQSWSAPRLLEPGSLDRPWAVADAAGTLYATWHRAQVTSGDAVFLARLTPEGEVRSRVEVQSGGDYVPAGIALSGTRVHVAYAEWDPTIGRLGGHRLNLSTAASNGTFGAPVELAVLPMSGRIGQGFGGIAVAPDGALAMAFLSGDGYKSDVLVAISRDGGARFDPPVRVNDDPGGAVQFLPWIVAEAAGFDIAWYDNRCGDTGIFHARSTDGGRTFGRNARVSDALFVGSEDSAQSSTWVGDFMGLARAGGRTVVAWGDTRRGVSRIFVSRTLDR